MVLVCTFPNYPHRLGGEGGWVIEMGENVTAHDPCELYDRVYRGAALLVRIIVGETDWLWCCRRWKRSREQRRWVGVSERERSTQVATWPRAAGVQGGGVPSSNKLSPAHHPQLRGQLAVGSRPPH